MANKSPDTKGIHNHSRKKKEDAMQRVNLAIEAKLNSCEPITVKGIADAAQVSRAYIYQNPDLKSRIDSLRGVSEVRQMSSMVEAKLKAKTKGLQTQLKLVSEKYRRLQSTNNKLRDENEELKAYIEELTEKLRETQQHAKSSKVISINNYNTNKE